MQNIIEKVNRRIADLEVEITNLEVFREERLDGIKQMIAANANNPYFVRGSISKWYSDVDYYSELIDVCKKELNLLRWVIADGYESREPRMTPYEKTRAEVYARGNKHQIENFEAVNGR